LNIISIKVWKL